VEVQQGEVHAPMAPRARIGLYIKETHPLNPPPLEREGESFFKKRVLRTLLNTP